MSRQKRLMLKPQITRPITPKYLRKVKRYIRYLKLEIKASKAVQEALKNETV